MKDLVDFFKILSDETRLRIIVLLYKQKLCVCDICNILELPQPKVSKHLAKLRDNGLVEDSRKEQFVYYSLQLKDFQKNIIEEIVSNAENDPVIKADLEKLARQACFKK